MDDGEYCLSFLGEGVLCVPEGKRGRSPALVVKATAGSPEREAVQQKRLLGRSPVPRVAELCYATESWLLELHEWAGSSEAIQAVYPAGGHQPVKDVPFQQ